MGRGGCGRSGRVESRVVQVLPLGHKLGLHVRKFGHVHRNFKPQALPIHAKAHFLEPEFHLP